jgi:hypothetical protein
LVPKENAVFVDSGPCAARVLLMTVGLLIVASVSSNAQDSASARNIADVLAEPTSVAAERLPLAQVLIDLARRHNLSILFDNDLVPGSAAYGDPRVTCELHRVSLGRALHNILDELGMDYVVRNNAVLIVTREKARLLNRWPTGSVKSANEIRITETLEQPTELDFNGQPLTDVVAYLEQKHGIAIQLDNHALKAAHTGGDTPVTLSIVGISLESALDLMLGELDLAWSIYDEVLLITSKVRASKLIETRVYPVFDLVATPPGQLPPVDGPDYDALVEVLSEAAALENESANPRWFRVYRPSGALIITRPILGHYRIEKLLAGLRRAKAGQSASP